MILRGKNVALSLLAVGVAAVAGYLLRSRGGDRATGQPKADVGARIVEDIPAEATVIDASSERLRELPGVGRAIRRAIRYDAREEWEHVTLEREGAWDIVDALRRSLPYYENDDDAHNGVYVRYDDRVVVLDAIGWARMEEPVQ
ncbi:hypothetical protein ACLI4U_14275 [Natrialbaceae archaeon A-CW2]|uniref:hypothetical protein n=1 Tax=Natronosalvus amylolyticus TaxID=2961994 RepID=UPI0020C993F5|nr:hypothetical protein [Natronosalvus amylolyticus]